MYKKFYDFVGKFNIPMNFAWPFFGQSFPFFFKSPSKIFKEATEDLIRLGGTSVFIIGFNASVLISDPKDIEEIMTNRKLQVKADVYSFLTEWLGDGLLVSNGEKWHQRRKIISNSFHFGILKGFVEIFDANSSILVDDLLKFSGADVDIFQKIALCTLDSVCETSMGVKVNAQINSDSNYVKAVKQ